MCERANECGEHGSVRHCSENHWSDQLVSVHVLGGRVGVREESVCVCVGGVLMMMALGCTCYCALQVSCLG